MLNAGPCPKLCIHTWKSSRSGCDRRPAEAQRGHHWYAESHGSCAAVQTFHDLRHTAASLAVQAGANVKAVQTMLGHASATMTRDTYAGLFDTDADALADALDAARGRAISDGSAHYVPTRPNPEVLRIADFGQ
jgi:integrase